MAEEAVSDSGGDQSVKVDFVPSDPPYELRITRKNEHAEYDVFGPNDIKDMTKFLGDLMRPEAQGMCSAALYNLLSATWLLPPKEEQVSTREASGEGGSES